MKGTVTIAQARATDLDDLDVVLIDGKWRPLLGIYREAGDVEAEFDQVYLERAYPELKKAVDAIEQHWDGDYVILRYVVQEKSAPGEVEDGIKVADALSLFDVQVRDERGSRGEVQKEQE